MVIAPKVDPEAEVWSNCGWTGRIKDALVKPDDLVRCPECGEPVRRGENLASINGLLRQIRDQAEHGSE